MGFRQTFFDHIKSVGLEKVHTETIGWIFGTCRALTPIAKVRLLNAFVGIRIGESENLKCETEIAIDIDGKKQRRFIDLRITTAKYCVLIENKVSSNEHSNQLQEYRSWADNNCGNFENTYVLLTLSGDEASDSNWKSKSYRQLLECLRLEYDKVNHASTEANNVQWTRDYCLLGEYVDCLQNIADVLNSVEKESSVSRYILTPNGAGRNKGMDSTNNDICRYIALNNLRKEASKHYYKVVQSKLSILLENHLSNQVTIRVDESSNSGTGLLQIDFINLTFEHKGEEFVFGLQLQEDSLKLNVKSKEYASSSRDCHAELLSSDRFKQALDTLKEQIGYKRRNQAVSKAYASLSIKSVPNTGKLFIDLSPDEAAKALRDEVQRVESDLRKCHQMVKEIVSEYGVNSVVTPR